MAPTTTRTSTPAHHDRDDWAYVIGVGATAIGGAAIVVVSYVLMAWEEQLHPRCVGPWEGCSWGAAIGAIGVAAMVLCIPLAVSIALVLLEVLRHTPWRHLRRGIQQGIAWSGLLALGAFAAFGLVAGVSALVAG